MLYGTVNDKKRQANALPQWWPKHMRNEAENLRQLLISRLEMMKTKTLMPYHYEYQQDELDAIIKTAEGIKRMLIDASEVELYRAEMPTREEVSA